MKMKLLVAVLLGVCELGSAQQYDSVEITDRKNPDEDNKIFVSGNSLIFSLSADSTKGLELPEKVIYTTVGMKNSKRLNRGQTEVVISYDPNQGVYQNTGIVENEENLWLHPPRTGFLKELELCPFPYVKFPLEVGSEWKDNIRIGQHWANGRWQGNLLVDLTYKVSKKEDVKTQKLRYDYWVIEAIGTSALGETKLIALYNEHLGFLEMNFEMLGGEKIHLGLESTKEGEPINGMAEYFQRRSQDNP